MLEEIRYVHNYSDAEAEERRASIERAYNSGGRSMDGSVHAPSGGVGGREEILFLGPATDHSIESLQIFNTWNVERKNGSVIAVHPYRRYWLEQAALLRSATIAAQVEMSLSTFQSEAAKAHTARHAETGGRTTTTPNSPMVVTNVANLNQHYVDVGVTTHVNGPPVSPPPPCGLAVPNYTSNPGLMRDCLALLEGKDTLRGTGTLNWSVDEAISDWDGITTAGTPGRVTKVELDDEDLTGTIPAGLGSLTRLTHLDLSDNSLTGDIPVELGLLSNLISVKLSGNSLTGCIPIGLEGVATNDLSSLSLLYCQPPAPGAPTAGTVTETSVPLTWTAASNVSTYRVEYREWDSSDWTLDSETITTTSHTVDELGCGTAYEFRLSGYGSGTTYAAAWSEPSETLTASTGACTPPVFGATSYSFSVMGDGGRGRRRGDGHGHRRQR